MLRFLSALLLLFIVPAATFCQDTVFVVKPKLAVAETEVFFSGDTALVRFLFDNYGKSVTGGSIASWYAGTREIGKADLASMGYNRLFGVKQFGDSMYYYAEGRKSKIGIYASILGEPTDDAVQVE